MRRKRRKQFLSWILAAAMALSMTGVTASKADAAEGEHEGYTVKYTMDENGYLTPDAESEELLESLHVKQSAELENQKFSWDNANVYFVLTDRFLNSDKSNDHSYGRGLDQTGAAVAGLDTYTNPGTFHGGDLGGLTQKVEEGYFTDLGVNAIWITAPYEQIHGYTSANVKSNNANVYPDPDGQGFPYYSYHGYWTIDYSNIDANMGTEKDFETFVDSCHAKGIRVIMDVVMNHLGYTTMQDAVDYGFDGALKGDWKTYYYGNSTYLMGGDPECENYWDKDSAAWAKWWGPGFVRADYPGYTAAGGDDYHMSLCGLPDVETEASAPEVPTPPLLVTKWTKEGRLDKEQGELDAFFSSTGYKKQPRYYIIKWLTDWVREYGVDGFRCDTAKHVDLDAWKDLKTEANKALKEWRENHKDKPGSSWTDDFWMTGEAWGHGMGKSPYFDNGGFDSMINFTFPKDGNLAAIEGTYSSYAEAINSDPDFNVLSYISSHDDSACVAVFEASAEKSKNIGTSLLLAPGGVQIYYGNEMNRKIGWKDFFTGSDYLDQRFRTDMDFTNYDKDVLAHWQKVGQFRNKHLSVGGGQHEMLGGDVYTFSRTYHLEDDDEDKVVCALPGKAGTYSIDVGSIFEDGETVTDFYSGEKYEVSGGAVSATCDANGVILLEGSGIVKPSVSAKLKGSTTYKADTVDVTLKANKAKDTYYSINGGAKKPYQTGDVIKVGGDTAYGEKTTIEVSGVSEEDGSPITRTLTCQRGEEPVVSNGLCVKASKTDFATAPNIFVYTNDKAETALNGKWPGAAMEDDGDAWVFNYEGDEESAVFIMSQGTWRSTPDMAPGIVFTGGVEFNKSTGTTTEIPTGVPGKVTVHYQDESGNDLKSIYRVGAIGKPYTTYAADIDGYTLSKTPDNAEGAFAENVEVVYVYSAGGSSSGGTTGGNPGGTTGGSTGDNPGGTTGGSTGDNPGGTTGGSTGDNPGGTTGGSTGDNPGGTTGGSTGDNPGGTTGGSTGDNPGGTTGGSTGDNPGGTTGGSTGDNPGGSTGGNSGSFPVQGKLYINASDVTVADANLYYTGQQVMPGVTVTVNGTVLTENVDYFLVYFNNVNPATADSAVAPTVMVFGNGNFDGTVTKKFTILPGNGTTGGSAGGTTGGGTTVPGGSTGGTTGGDTYVPGGSAGGTTGGTTGGSTGTTTGGDTTVPGGSTGTATGGGTTVPGGGTGTTTGGGTHVPGGSTGTTTGGDAYVPGGSAGTTTGGDSYVPGGSMTVSTETPASTQTGEAGTTGNAGGDSGTASQTGVQEDEIQTDDHRTGYYEVSGSGTVTFVLPVSNAVKVDVPATVSMNGVTYSVTEIEDGAFENSAKLQTVKVGSNVTRIGENAFSGCRKLKSVSLPAGLKVIGAEAFRKCTSLNSIVIPARVSKIGKGAFYGCKKLKVLSFKTSLLSKKNVGAKAFKGIYSKALIKVPKNKYSTYKKMLKAKGAGSKCKYKKQ